MSKVLVVAVHPDDETLGCGGSLLKHKKNGDSVNWLIVTKMDSSLGFSEDKISKRREEIKSVSDSYDFDEVMELGIPTTRVDSIPMNDRVKLMMESINRIKPDILYIPFCSDAHSDHKLVFEALSPCFKSFRYPYIKKILMMETVSETEHAYPVEKHGFVPNYFVDITEEFNMKLDIMRTYKSELQEAPFPRSEKIITALAEYRGSFIFTEYAEAFILIKEVCL